MLVDKDILSSLKFKMIYSWKKTVKKLKWPTLETPRLYLLLVECYKIVFGIKKLNFDYQV